MYSPAAWRRGWHTRRISEPPLHWSYFTREGRWCCRPMHLLWHAPAPTMSRSWTWKQAKSAAPCKEILSSSLLSVSAPMGNSSSVRAEAYRFDFGILPLSPFSVLGRFAPPEPSPWIPPRLNCPNFLHDTLISYRIPLQ